MKILPKVLKLVLGYKGQIAAGMACMVLYALFTVAPAKYMKDIVDALGSGKVPQLHQFLLVGLGIVLVFFFKGIFFFGQNFLMAELGQKLTQTLRENLFHKVLGMPLGFFTQTQTGNLVSRFTVDLHYFAESVKIAITGPLRDFPQILMLLGLMAYRSWQLFLLILVLLPIAAYFITKFGQQNSRVTTQRQNQFGDLTSLVSETISGIRVVKAFGMEDYEINRFRNENDRLYQFFRHSATIGSYSYPVLEILGGICGAMILTMGGYLIVQGQITGGDFASFLLAFFMMNEPIKKFNGFTLKIQEGQAAARRIFEVLDSPWETEEKPQTTFLPPLEREIRFEIHRFSYGDKAVLQDVHFCMPQGTVTALVGASGSGKTTLANLLPRFYDIPPAWGRITIDGQDIHDASLESLRGQIAIVTQEVVLFHDTVANNISYGKIDCDPSALRQAAQAAHALGFIEQLPQGFDTLVGEKGIMLSGGQRQRLSIARALIKNAPILILDEATSALDSESEMEVQAAIENLTKNRTSLVIAHRLSTIRRADQIHVLKEGRIVESGTHLELLSAEGEYHRLYQMQFKDQPT